MYSLVILICFISTDKELHKVDQQTQVDKKSGTYEASILSQCIAYELIDFESGSNTSGDFEQWMAENKGCDLHVINMCQ